MTTVNYNRLVTALLVCSLLLAPIASAGPLGTGSKDASTIFIYSSNGGLSITGTLYTSTAFQINKFQTDEKNDMVWWEQDFTMLQGNHVKQVEPPTSVEQPLDSITKSYGKVLYRSDNMLTIPVTSENLLTGGAPVNNPEDKKLATAVIGLATTMTTELFTNVDPAGVIKLAKKVENLVKILAPVFSSTPGERWTVEFDHKTGAFQTAASTSSHYITFETFTSPNQKQITGTGNTGNAFKTTTDLIRAGTEPACFTYESGVEIHAGVSKKVTSKTFVFIRPGIGPNIDPRDHGARYSFKLAPDGKTCDTAAMTAAKRAGPSAALAGPVIGDELEQVLEAWGSPAK